MICIIKNYPTKNPYILYTDERKYLEEFSGIISVVKYIRNYFIKNITPIQIPIRFEYKDKIIMFAHVAINN